jgi:hypothetical protein
MTRRNFPLTIAASLLLLLLTQFAAAADWIGIRSGNLFIAGQTSEADLRVIAGRLERFRSALGTLSPRLRTDTAHPVNVLVFPDDPAFSSFGLKRENGTFDEAVAGYFLRGEDSNFIAITGKRASDPYHTIFHEYVHNLLRPRGAVEVPAWLNEGLAQYFETADFTLDRKAMLGLAPKGRIELLAKSELIPLKTLLATTNEEVHSGGTPRTVFYAQSWLLVHQLLSSSSGSTFKDRLERIFELSSDHAAIEKLVSEKAAGSGPESGLRAYAASRPGTYTYELNLEESGLFDAASERITPAAADSLLGGLLLRSGRTPEAEAFVRKSLAADKSSIQANSSLGEILVSKEKYSDARAALETAERAGELSPMALFNLAYSLVKETGDKDDLIGKIPTATADRARGYLKRTIQLRPAFVEPYKLLAHISLINNDQLRESSAFLATAIALRPGDAELQLMLAKTYLRLEKYRDATAIAEAIVASSATPAIKKEALEIKDASSEYLRKTLELSAGSGSATADFLILKRSWLNDEDLKQIELNRELSNLNSVLDRPRPGEVQMIGSIEKITCSDGAIAYTVVSDGAPFKLWSSKFEDLRLSVLVQGMHSFKLDCGVRFAGQKAVLLHKTAEAGKGGRPELTSVTFVPENFQLMNKNDLMASRLVVVEDDMRLRGRERDSVSGYSRVSEAERYSSIKDSLRKPEALEKQIIGRLDRVDCANGTTRIKAIAGDREWLFTAATLSSVAVNWFSSKALNFRLACGAESSAAGNVLLTYKPNATGGPPELTGIEFIPADLPLTALPLGPSGKSD